MDAEAQLGAVLPVWTILPFAAVLLAIAVGPLLAPHAWERNRVKAIVLGLLAAPVPVYLWGAHGSAGAGELLHKAEEYVSFIVLLASLFVITGGIVIRGSLSGTPLVNTVLMGIGAILASFIGTTGASILLIRPLLRANETRVATAHVVIFFIFTVSNCGGLLTPLGDPPLFLGFLKGVPFEWTLGLWPQWLVVNGLLLAVFNVWDQVVFAREERERPGSQLEAVMEHEPLAIVGRRGFLFLLAVILVIYASGRGLGHGGVPWPFGVKEVLMLALTTGAWIAARPSWRRENRFGFGPIAEVAIVFAAIFASLAPALLILNANAHDLGLREPWQFFWATGLLSSVLDNAPTYLTFAATAAGLQGVSLEGAYLARLLQDGAEGGRLLAAISCGAVFMGAMTYIGNGPNFMVKSIAEQAGVGMPGFFGYMLYSLAVLLPLLALDTWLFYLS